MQLIRTSLQPRRVAVFSQLDQGHTQRDTRHPKTPLQAHLTVHNLFLLWLKQPYKHQVCDSPPGLPLSTLLPSAVDVSPSSLGSQDYPHQPGPPRWTGAICKASPGGSREQASRADWNLHMGADLLLVSEVRASWQHPWIKQGVRVSLSGHGGDKGGPSGKPEENTHLLIMPAIVISSVNENGTCLGTNCAILASGRANIYCRSAGAGGKGRVHSHTGWGAAGRLEGRLSPAGSQITHWESFD